MPSRRPRSLLSCCNLATMIVPATEARIVLTTASSREEAERIARFLVEEHLAACANLVSGISSIYRWQGEIETSEEVLLLIKTSAGSIERLEAALHQLHSYDVPELLVLHPEAAAKPWLDWLLHNSSTPP